MTRAAVGWSCMSRTFAISEAKERLGYGVVVDMEEGIWLAASWYGMQEDKKVVIIRPEEI